MGEIAERVDDDPEVEKKVLSAKWLNTDNTEITKSLANSEVKIELSTEGFNNGNKVSVLVKEQDGDTLKTLNLTVNNDQATHDKLKLDEAWVDKKLIVVVEENVSTSYTGDKILEVEAQFQDPLDSMKIRKNRASNLFGKVRTENNVANSKNHQGFDYYAAEGTTIKAVSDGEIKKIEEDTTNVKDYGKQIVMKIDNSTYYAFYAHLSKIDVKLNDKVKKGATLGESGKTGNAKNLTGGDQHLHFECRDQLSPGKGLTGRKDPNLITVTKFYTQDDATEADGSYTNSQTNAGIKKVTSDGTETFMSVE